MSKFIDKEQLNIGGVLYDTLVEHEVITEGFARKTLANIDILIEKENRENGEAILLEARKPTRTNSKLGPDYYNIKGVDVSMDVFSRVWKDYERFSTPDAVATAIGVHPDHWLNSNLTDPRRSMVSDLTDLSYYAYHQGFIDEHVTWSNRAKVFGERQRQEKFSVDDPRREEAPTKDDIDFGHRGRDNSRAGRSVDKINEKELLPGELYSNMSRIPKTRWAGWLRFWDREKTSLPKDKSLIGREWKKTFLIGYQVEPSVVYEIWYNSIDSSFSIHDHRGNQMTRRYPTLQEAMKNMFSLLFQHSTSTDQDVMTNVDNNIALSIGRTLSNDFSKSDRMKDMMARERKEEKKRRKEEKERAKKEKRTLKQRVDAGIDSVSRGVDNTVQFVSDVKDTREKTRDLGRKVRDMMKDNEFEREKAEREERVNDAESKREKAQNEFVNKAREEMERRRKEREEKLRRAEEMEKQQREERAESEARFNDLVGDLDIKKMSISDGADAFEKRQKEEKRARDVNAVLAAAEQMRKQAMEDEATPKLKSDDEHKLPKPSDLKESEDGGSENVDEEIPDEMALNDMETEVRRLGNDPSYKTHVDGIRKRSEASRYTAAALKNTVMGEIVEVYRQTRVNRNWMNSWWGRYILRGRKDKIVMPNDKPNIFRQAGNFVQGKRYISDFILGFSIENRANIEIWYITEPNPNYSWKFSDLFRANTDVPKMISSFYVFDIESQTLLRKYLPHYRNAVQVAINKIAPVN